MIRIIKVLIVSAIAMSPAHAEEAKFVGVWEGKHGTAVYTKLVFHDDQSVTYCDVSSCRYVNCMKMDVTGSLTGTFSYIDVTGEWEFVRVSESEIEARFINGAGDVSTALYEPE